MESYTNGERWPAWCDEVAFAPTAQETREACQMFGALSGDEVAAEFETWLEGLEYERFRSVTRAIDTLRSALIEYHGDVDPTRLLGRIDLD
jgi:hypothetical protein